jgi:hypothetical protein
MFRFTRIMTDLSVIAVTLWLPGCLFSPRDRADNTAEFLSQEIANMGGTGAALISGGAPAKAAAAMADTFRADLVIHPFAWDSIGECFIRSATYTTSEGYERVRIDTIIFKDAGGLSLRHPTIATVATVQHIRSVTHQKGGNQANVRIVINGVLTVAAETTYVKNGTISGTYNDETFATGTITNVTRHYTSGSWRFPDAGSIVGEFPKFTYEVNFLGAGDARVDITTKSTGNVRELTIHVDDR